jgi:hypothetical protein
MRNDLKIRIDILLHELKRDLIVGSVCYGGLSRSCLTSPFVRRNFQCFNSNYVALFGLYVPVFSIAYIILSPFLN